MITGMNHTGFVVRNLDKAVEFYRQVLGLKVVRATDREGAPISQVVGYENTHLKGALLSLGDGHALELLQYISPIGSERPTEERNTLGASHLAFNVEDIDATFQELIGQGAQKLNPPVELVPGRRTCYLQDPDGNWIELIEAMSRTG